MRTITKKPINKSNLQKKWKLIWVLIIFNFITVIYFILMKQFLFLLIIFAINAFIIIFVIGNFKKFKGNASKEGISMDMEK